MTQLVSRADAVPQQGGYKVGKRLAIATAAGAVIGGAAIVVGGPLALVAVEFSSIGPVAGSRTLPPPCIKLMDK